MPSKKNKKQQEQQSKKALQKKKEKMLEDKTFGLKNKNKSSKVQAFVKGQERSIMNAGSDARSRAEEQKKKQEKLAKKAMLKAKKAEQEALFGEALLAVGKKGPKFGSKQGKVEAKGRDHDDGEKKGGTSRAMKMMFQMDAKEMEERLRDDPNYVPTLEDKVEAQRQKKLKELKDSGKKGTPVTEETFKKWQERKRKRKEAEAKKKVDAEMKKKKGGKGLSVLSGRELYNYKKDLFKDQDGEGGAVVDTKKLEVDGVADKVEKDLFLDGADDDLDDLDDD
ncbi:hypothetical protein THAOC_34045 [Thalassiosira oceanica]|uniref:ZC3H15/TMA46 family C-terminal domain-containing protein n=1 Tax=Thalassiosira oceanica TaxID=159749 RepID=K0RDY7_THAOC|nr:hypothetical protein THAOC_34045 [Thalassiosira oceanica]|mmetsp:Transcript_23820/g.56415  ORF Transcript_23820/g.56415 Transcript_23820/m.56415 type:complete len:280 (+) Transcript_23820:483-1322(+)|eukprot:EJK47251.1 hypothetical protein THAOC_34045 [Thalassiosira oceanica]